MRHSTNSCELGRCAMHCPHPVSQSNQPSSSPMHPPQFNSPTLCLKLVRIAVSRSRPASQVIGPVRKALPPPRYLLARGLLLSPQLPNCTCRSSFRSSKGKAPRNPVSELYLTANLGIDQQGLIIITGVATTLKVAIQRGAGVVGVGCELLPQEGGQ